jgi:predicted transcriptional regulator
MQQGPERMFRPLFRGNPRDMDEPKDFIPSEPAERVPPEWEEALLNDDSWDEHDEEAMADLEAGRKISHEAMVRWLRSWGTENELPPPECDM